MSFLYNNVAAITVALVASLMAWIFGGCRGEYLVPVVPWLFAFMVEVLLCFPQRHKWETTYEARARVWHELRRSPLLWVSIGLLVLLMIPFVNNGLCVGCDAAQIAEGFDPAPPAPFLPFCVNRLDQLDVVHWFAMALPALVIVHHGLTRRGKRMVIKLIVWNGVALAALGFVQGATGARGPFWCDPPGGGEVVDFFSTFGYPNMAGDYFVTLFGLAMALWRDQYEEMRRAERSRDPADKQGINAKAHGRFWQKHYYLIPAAIFFYAALNTLSRAAIILVTVTAAVYFLHTMVVFLSRMRKSRRVVVGVWSTVVLGLIIFFASIFMPEDMQREVNTLGTTEVLDRVTGRGQYHAQVATAIWKDYRLFGCGGWGYRHFCVPKMQELDIDLAVLQKVGGINVHNDYLQFLAEHGLVGFGAIVALVVLLLLPIARQWRRMVKDLRFKKAKELPPKPIQIFVLPAPVFFMLTTVVASLVHAFGDCPFRSAAVMTLFFITLAALPGFMPKREMHEPSDKASSHHHHEHSHK